MPIPSSATSIVANALCKVFEIPKNIEDYCCAIEDVFGQVQSALLQVHIFEDIAKDHELPLELLRQIQYVLTSIVKVCAHVVKYKQGKRTYRLMQKVKVAFGGDVELSKAMEEFKEYAYQQQAVRGTIALAAALDTKGNSEELLKQFLHQRTLAEKIHDGMQGVVGRKERVDTLIKIQETFGVKLELDNNTTPECEEIEERCLPSTGDWIWNLEEYKNWSDPGNKITPHVLLMSGPASSGVSVRPWSVLESCREEGTSISLDELTQCFNRRALRLLKLPSVLRFDRVKQDAYMWPIISSLSQRTMQSGSKEARKTRWISRSKVLHSRSRVLIRLSGRHLASHCRMSLANKKSLRP